MLAVLTGHAASTRTSEPSSWLLAGSVSAVLIALMPTIVTRSGSPRERSSLRPERSTEDAVRKGIAGSAGITAAAVVMVLVFSVFATLSFIDFKEMGVGLAVAILIDATIIRGVLLPASMKLLGDWNWYLPRWLEWLPRIEGDSAPEDQLSGRPEAQPVGV